MWSSFWKGSPEIDTVRTPTQVLSALLTVDGPGSLLDADTVDGVEAAALAQLGTVETFTAAQTINTTSSNPLVLISSAAGASGVFFNMTHNSASPAAADVIGVLQFIANDDAGVADTVAQIQITYDTVTAGAEDVHYSVRTMQGGVRGTRVTVGLGMQAGSPTGGDKGVGTINAVAVYDDNVLLTCPALQEEYLKKGKVDLEKWDALVPDRVTPETREQVSVTETVKEKVKRISRDDNGVLVETIEVREVERQIKYLEPVFDKDGNGVDAIEIAATEEIVTPEVSAERQHVVAHLFQTMIDEGFDPRDPLSYLDRMERDQALPGMPTEGEWEHSKYSLGELASRKWLAMEFLALAFRGLVQQHQALVARVTALENL